ncbi:C-type lectin domain family 2 member E-like isoform X2 [Tyto alba]|uniref:C-type lectin domain family 2 member E-like isoform X2 n=1 Tax=Tyto alba TaxID=56313 RepID=UPI001C676F0D|nr:C-type lectin domain family 2 member E-like isoform X2 [Tyto alba]
MAEALRDAGEDSTAAVMPSHQRAEEGTTKKCPSCPSCPSPVLPSCLENGIGYREKCFYFVEDEADWNRSQTSCLSLGAHLATIDSREELSFLSRYGNSSRYWVGLRREGFGPWKWFNGSLFNNLFDVRGSGQCAYINGDGIDSDQCSQMKYSVCSHQQKRPSALRKDSEILLNVT